MNMIEIRKIVTVIDDSFHDGGPARKVPRKKAAVAAVIKNPFAGRYEEKIVHFMEDLEPLGLEMAAQLIKHFGDAQNVEGYGKAVLSGLDGELEHCALWHAPGGYAMRQLLGKSNAIVPSTKKVGAAGCSLDVPIQHINAAYVRDHFDTITVSIPDAPKPDELIMILAMSDGERIHARSGGLKASEIEGKDGLR
ncbi:MAG: amino acid synthesis family protein [SAR324 cluster bacterium]|nr:amino acid synthesis family protein [SAR324 cluster bacterium]